MTKFTITRVIIGSLIAMAAGFVLFLVAGAFAFGSASFVMNGPDVVGIQGTPLAWSMVAVAAIGIVVIVGGAIGQLVAWIGAVLNTARLEDKTWFLALLLLGLLSFGFVATVAYVIAGPDGTRGVVEPRRSPMQPVPSH